MNEDFVTYEQAVKLKELGFDWKCYQFYNADKKLWSYTSIGYGDDCRDWNDNDYAIIGNAECSAPTLAQAQKWLREKHYLSIEVYSSLDIDYNHEYDGFIKNLNDASEDEIEDSAISCKTYEEALSKGIDKALELLKQQSK